MYQDKEIKGKSQPNQRQGGNNKLQHLIGSPSRCHAPIRSAPLRCCGVADATPLHLVRRPFLMRRRSAVVVGFAFRRRRGAPTLKPFFLLVVVGLVGFRSRLLSAAAYHKNNSILRYRPHADRTAPTRYAIPRLQPLHVYPMFLCQRQWLLERRSMAHHVGLCVPRATLCGGEVL